MAKKTTLGGNGEVMVGDDLDVELEVLSRRTGLPLDITGWTIVLVISLTNTTTALITKSGTVGGTYNAVRATNTQRCTFELLDTELDDLTSGDYEWSARRTDAGSERVLAFGPLKIERANQI